MALFITFEGGEGSGKSTQASLLYRYLKKRNIPSLLTHEPGVTSLGKKIARLLKWSQGTDISPAAELLLFNTSRAQLVTEIIKPALQNGITVICDRFADSTTAYQGYGRNLDLAIVKAVNEVGMSGLDPDITFLLDTPVEKGLSRKTKNEDRFEKEASAFHQRVRDGYLKLAGQEPKRWCVIDAAKSKEEIAGIIWDRVKPLLPNYKSIRRVDD
jgi:dTMP kinase